MYLLDRPDLQLMYPFLNYALNLKIILLEKEHMTIASKTNVG